jgi:undecaprenyl-diphosphatase
VIVPTLNETVAAADYIASHALIVLLLLTLAGSCMSALGWHLILKSAPAVWAAWSRTLTRPAVERAWLRMQSLRYVGSACKGTLGAARFLGIYAACSFVAALVAVAGFLELVEAIDVDGRLGQFDHALSAALGRHLSDAVLQALAIVTHLGDSWLLSTISGAIVLTLWFKRERLLALACLVAAAGGGTLTTVLKHYFARARPVREHLFTTVGGYSFPSGHASGSMLVYGLLGYLIVRHTPSQWHIPTVIVTMAVIVFVGGSRILLQVHFLSDVLAGWASATAWLALWIAGMEVVRRRTAL